MTSFALNYALYFLASYLTTISAQTLLEINMTDSKGSSTIRFQQEYFVKFYNCLCHSRTKTCTIRANRRDDANSLSQGRGRKTDSFQYKCLKIFGRNAVFRCSRLYDSESTTSCTSDETCWTFYVNPRETQCDFAGSISITWKTRSLFQCEPRNLSISDCLYGCNGHKVTTALAPTIASIKKDELGTSTWISTTTISQQTAVFRATSDEKDKPASNFNTNEPDFSSGFTEATIAPLKKFDSDENETKFIAGIVVGVFLCLMIAVLVVGFIYFKKRRKRSYLNEGKEKFKTHFFKKRSSHPHNTGKPQLKLSGQSKSSNVSGTDSALNTTLPSAVSNSTKAQRVSDTNSAYCYAKNIRNINDSLPSPPYEQGAYCNIDALGQVKEKQIIHATNDKGLESFKNTNDATHDDILSLSSCYEIPVLPAEAEGISKQNVNNATTNKRDLGVAMTNSYDSIKEGKDYGIQTTGDTRIEKLNLTPAYVDSALKEPPRKIGLPYKLSMGSDEYEKAKQISCDEPRSSRQMAMYFELENEGRNVSSGQTSAHQLTDPHVKNDVANIYEGDPYDETSENIYYQID